MHYKVEGERDLLRDMDSTAIINKNMDALRQAKEQKKKRLQMLSDVNMLKEKVQGMESKLDKILLILESK